MILTRHCSNRSLLSNPAIKPGARSFTSLLPGAPSGTRTPNPLIKRQIHPESDLREPLRSNGLVSASVCSRLPLSAVVAVKFSCQTRYPISCSGGVLSSGLLVEAAGR
jgi:hypothetical protein